MTLTQSAIDWLEARGLEAELAGRYGLRSFVPGNGGETLAIPYVVGGEDQGSKYRALDDKRFWSDKGNGGHFWNRDAINDPTLSDDALVIAEGELDALAVIQAGRPRAVSVPSGAQSSEGDGGKAFRFLDEARRDLKSVAKIILATDDDAPGRAVRDELARRLGRGRCWWVRYPKGCKDANDVLRLHGASALRKVIDDAEPMRLDGVYRMDELPPFDDRPAISTGFAFLDQHWRIRQGDFSVITGIPAHGKSTFVNDLACRLVDQAGWHVTFASFEQHPASDHKRALRRWRIGSDPQNAGPASVASADRWIVENFAFIVPPDDVLANLEWTLQRMADAVQRYGSRLIVLDPWNEIDHAKPPDMSLTEYTGFAIKELKRFARSLDTHVMVVAHPTKLARGEEPGLYSISDSAHWANKADTGVVIFRRDPGEQVGAVITEIRVLKQRYHEILGKPGKVETVFDPVRGRFYEAHPIGAAFRGAA